VALTHKLPTDWRYPGAENFSFVTDGIEAAVALAQQVVGEKNVGVARARSHGKASNGLAR
jgi:hypothetical protein